MTRPTSDTDFDVYVDDIGNFRFAKRTMRDEIKIQVEYARMIDGVEPTEWLALICGWMAALKVLTVKAPEGWDFDNMDPLDTDTYNRIGKVHRFLRDRETGARKGAGKALPPDGQGARGDSGVLVPEEVRPAGN